MMIRPNEMNPGDVRRDNAVRGLSLRRNRNGYSWSLYYKTRSGIERRPKIGEYPALQLPDARKVAKELLARVALGEDPVGEWKAKRAQGTVAELARRYLEDHAINLRSYQVNKATINRHIIPALGRLKIGEVQFEHVQQLHSRISKRSPAQANRTLAILSKMYSLAEQWQLAPRNTNPCRGVKRVQEKKRFRYMKPDEAKRIGEALQHEDPIDAATIRLLMLTGARRGELAGRVLQREGNLAIIGQHKTGEHKMIRLPDVAIKLIEDLNLDGKALTPPRRVSKVWGRVCRRAGVADLKLHDLRHTFASVGLSAGVPLSVVGNLLGHTDPKMTQRYAHLADEAGAAAVNTTANQIDELLKG